MKKILFVIPSMRMGGAEKALISLLKSLDPARVTVDLFLFEHGGVLQKQIPAWVNILPEDSVTRGMTLELRTYWKDLLIHGKIGAAVSRLWMSIRSPIRSRLHLKPASSWKTAAKHISAVSGEYDAAIGFLEGFADFFVLDKTAAKKKIAWIHSDLGIQRLSDEDIDSYNRFDACATITEACKRSFAGATGVSQELISVVENIVSSEQILQLADEIAPAWQQGVPHILTVGRLEYQKGSDIGLEACRLLAEKKAKFCWHFIGTGSLLEKLRKAAAESGVTEYCVFEGQKENPYPYIKCAELIVQPSRVEGKSIVLDEAKILGKAIVVTDYPSVTDQIEDGVTGIVTQTRPEAIADGIIRLLHDDVLRLRLEQNCRQSSSDTSEQALGKFYALIQA